MKINGVNTTSIVKINGIAKASITKVSGVTISAGPTPPSPIATNIYDAGNATSYPGSGTTWYNIGTGGTKNVTLNNGVGYSLTGGGSLTFNGTNQYGRIIYDSTFNFSTGNYCMNAWVKFNTIVTTTVTSKDTNGANFDWCMYLPTNSSMYNYSNGTATNVNKTLSPALSTGVWYNLTITSTGNSITMFLNGVQQGTATSMSVSNADTIALTIGCVGQNIQALFLNGSIGMMEYYNVGLTAPEVLAKFNYNKARFGY